MYSKPCNAVCGTRVGCLLRSVPFCILILLILSRSHPAQALVWLSRGNLWGTARRSACDLPWRDGCTRAKGNM